MKKMILALTALLCLGVPGAAVADDALEAQLRDRIQHLTEKVGHKSDLLACERANRRALERALRTGEDVFVRTCK